MLTHYTTGKGKTYDEKATVITTHAINDDDADSFDVERDGRSWQAGLWPRFPVLSLVCFVLILACMIGIVIILLKSDRQSIQTWDSVTIIYRGKPHLARFSVSGWISLLNFVMGKAIAAMFAGKSLRVQSTTQKHDSLIPLLIC